MSVPICRCIVLAGLAGVVLALGGCGSKLKTAPVQGKISYKGKPVPNGTITFIPADGPTATGEIQPDGFYTLTTERPGDGAVLGEHKVIIVAQLKPAGALPEEAQPPPPPIVPLKYTSAATTDLQANVKDEKNIINFDLQEDSK